MDKTALTWRLLQILPAQLARPEFAPLSRFLAAGDWGRRMQLAERLADLFDQYQVYRSDWLAGWASGTDGLPGTRREQPVPDDQRWQPLLWRELVASLGAEALQSSRPELHRRFIRSLASGAEPAAPVPRRVILFGLSTVPQQTLEALHALSSRSQVILAIPNPCRFHWADIMDGRELLRAPRKRHPDRVGLDLAALPLEDMHAHANPLLAGWGRQGRDFVRQLDAYENASAHHAVPRVDLFDEGDGHTPDTRAFRHGSANPLDIDLLIVDEASMVHLEMMAALLDALPPHTRVILLDDKDQLASVEAGSVLGDLCGGLEGGSYADDTRTFLKNVLGMELPGAAATGSPMNQQTVMLQESRRFAGRIGALALAVNAGDAVHAAALLREAGQTDVSWAGAVRGSASVQGEALRLALGTELSGGYRRYCELLLERPIADEVMHSAWVQRVLEAYDSFRVLCAVREGEGGSIPLNAAIERALVSGGLLNKNGEWYEGRPVMVTRSDPAAGVYNGDVGVALRTAQPGGALRVYFANGTALRSVLTTRLGHVESAFAMTVHKSQGSEFGHTVLALGSAGQRTASRELVYTGITRAREVFTLVASEPGALAAPLARKTRRGSGLAGLIDGV
jgi:hypothetical protein